MIQSNYDCGGFFFKQELDRGVSAMNGGSIELSPLSSSEDFVESTIAASDPCVLYTETVVASERCSVCSV